MIWIHDVLPPVVEDPVPAPGGFGDVPEPPFVMFTGIAMAPLCSCDRADGTLEVGKVVQPVIALAWHRGWIVPIVILLAVGSEVDVAHSSFARRRFLITDEALPQILLTA